jgi:hypothetical protein
MQLLLHASQLKDMIKSLIPKPGIGIVFHNVILANQEVSGIHNSRFKH